MPRQIQVLLDEDVYEQLQALIVSPGSNISAVIRELLDDECPKWGAEAALDAGSNSLHPAEFEHPVQEINEEY